MLPGQAPFPRSIVFGPDLRRYAESWGRPSDCGFLALGPDGFVGGAWLRLFTAEERGFGYVSDLTPELSVAVLPGYRGKGVGTSLLISLITGARQQFSSISLSVSKTNSAVRLYERLGFTSIEQRGSSIVMELRWR